MVNSRDIGLRGVGAGKGDKPRTKFDEDYRKNYAAIFPPDQYAEHPSASPNFKRVAAARWRRVFK